MCDVTDCGNPAYRRVCVRLTNDTVPSKIQLDTITRCYSLIVAYKQQCRNIFTSLPHSLTNHTVSPFSRAQRFHTGDLACFRQHAGHFMRIQIILYSCFSLKGESSWVLDHSQRWSWNISSGVRCVLLHTFRTTDSLSNPLTDSLKLTFRPSNVSVSSGRILGSNQNCSAGILEQV